MEELRNIFTNCEFECSIFKWCIMGSKNDGVPEHNVILSGRPRNAGWRVIL